VLEHEVLSNVKAGEGYFEPRYRLRQAAEATGFSLNTLRSSFQRAWFRSVGDETGVGQGRAQRLCLADIFVLAIAQRLIALGIHPVEAFNGAFPFARGARQFPGVPKRQPGALFDSAQYQSVFIWKPGAASQVIPVGNGEGIPLGELGLLDGEGTICILLNPLIEPLLQKLDAGTARRG
jgi:hypothetical protein